MRGKNASRVTFTDAAGETATDGTLHDIGRGGMFVATASKLATGKRIEFEVHLPGSTISGMGRVIWTRDEARDELPAGIGVKFIDVDNDALLAIDRIVGLKKNVRERTMLGMAAPLPPVKVEAPKVEPAKVETPKVEPPKVETKPAAPRPIARERTMLGIAPPAAPREEELSWPDVPPEPPPEPPAAPPEEVAKPEPVAEPAEEPEKPTLVEPAKPEPEKAEPESPKLELVAEASVPGAEPEPPPRAKMPSTPRVASAKAPIVPRELPKREERKRGWMIAVLLLVVLGVVAFMLRDRIASVMSGTPTTPSAAPSVSALASTSAAEVSSAPTAVVSATPPEPDAGVASQTATEEAVDASVNTVVTDAATHNDSGHHDAGNHHHDAGLHAHAHPHASSATDNPY
jgi:uncharacterized protein (TIGR02266 family)